MEDSDGYRGVGEGREQQGLVAVIWGKMRESDGDGGHERGKLDGGTWQ